MAYLAPAGTVTSLAEITRGFARAMRIEHAREQLLSELRRRSEAAYCWPVSSGRAAMTLLLRAMSSAARDPGRDEVLIPAYTCYSVPASIARAGLRPRLCDVDPRTQGMDLEAMERCDFSRVLAVVTSNLYGIPNELAAIEAIARRRGVFMLDDAAQALGARYAGRAVGAFGDGGLYSFDKGKIICTIQGGAMVCRDATLGTELARLADALERSSARESLVNAAKLPVYALFLRPTLYGAIRRLPLLGLGRTEYETRYPISRLSNAQIGVAAVMLQRLDCLNEQRRHNAAQLRTSLCELPGVTLASTAADAQPVYARFPIRIRDPQTRVRAVRALDRAGIGATISYPCALADVPEVGACLRSPDLAMPGAREVANQIVTLPTHGYCPPDFARRVRDVLAGILRGAAGDAV